MRRIIERTVTIVTTTIWRISWQEDAVHASCDPQADPARHNDFKRSERGDPAIDEFPKRDISQETVQDTRQFPPVIEAKEVDLSVTESSDEINGG